MVVVGLQTGFVIMVWGIRMNVHFAHKSSKP
jgi:hypothetical protein